MSEQKFIECVVDTLELQREDIMINHVDDHEGRVDIEAVVKIRHNCYITIAYLEDNDVFEWEVERLGTSNESLLNAVIDYTMRVDQSIERLQHEITATETKAKAARKILTTSLEIL